MMLAQPKEVGVRGGCCGMGEMQLELAETSCSRLPNPYNAATYRPKLSRRIPSIVCFPILNNEKHTKS